MFKNGFVTNKIRHHIADILQYLRLSYSLRQEDFAKILGCSRYKIGRIEAGKAELTAQEFILLCKNFDIQQSCFVRGFLYIPERQESDFYNFKIPLALKSFSFSKGRILYFHTQNFKKIMGEDRFRKFCEREGVNSVYFVNLANSINISFLVRMLQELIISGALSSDRHLVEYVDQMCSSPVHHFNLSQKYSGCSGFDKVELFINNISNYESNHLYLIKDINNRYKYMDIELQLGEHVDKKLYFDSLGVEGFSMFKLIPTYISKFMEVSNSFFLLEKNTQESKCVIRYQLR